MKYEDLSFITKDQDGEELINDIISVVPNVNNSDEPYVVFTDYTLDSNEEFIKKYGRIVHENDNFFVNTNLKYDEIEYIKKMLDDEIVKYVNDAIEENLHE